MPIQQHTPQWPDVVDFATLADQDVCIIALKAENAELNAIGDVCNAVYSTDYKG